MVLLHALGERGSRWASVATRLAQRFFVISLDLRGHGTSGWPGQYSFQLMCDDVRGALDELDLARVMLVGHSMGGVVAYLLAIQHPDRVERLIIEDATPFPRTRKLPERPTDPLEFDWTVVSAMVGEVNARTPVTWDQLTAIRAPTLLIAGGPASHIPQDQLGQVAKRIARCTLITIPAGHSVHMTLPREFADAILSWITP
jgi:pimeloyl-ACP methyl ester carboxylesterase